MAVDADSQFFSLTRLDRTVRRTVELGPSAALRFDAKVGRTVVANLEPKREVLAVSPDGVQRHYTVFADELGVGVHFEGGRAAS